MLGEARGHIVAMGGGGFAMEPENPLLDDFVLSLAGRQPARVCFVPTAAGDSAAFIGRFYRASADGAALHFAGRDLVEVVSSRATARAYRVALEDGAVVEQPLPTRFLGG